MDRTSYKSERYNQYRGSVSVCCSPGRIMIYNDLGGAEELTVQQATSEVTAIFS